jgi:hypothetical protein
MCSKRLVHYVVGAIAWQCSTAFALSQTGVTPLDDSVAVHFTALATSASAADCVSWSDSSMRVHGRAVTSACTSLAGDTSIYFYKTEQGDLFAVGRDVQLRLGHPFEASARAESGLIATYGMPIECNTNDWRFLTKVKRVLQWRRSEYSITFQTTVASKEPDDQLSGQPMQFAIQIVRGRPPCADVVPRPSRE